MENNEQDAISNLGNRVTGDSIPASNKLSHDEKLILEGFRLMDADYREVWLFIAQRLVKKSSTITVKPCLALVSASVNQERPRRTKRRKSLPAIPRQLSSALKGLESGELDVVSVVGVVEGEERVFNVSAGVGNELTDILYEPFVSTAPPAVNGNVISFNRPLTAVEQITAIGVAFAAGRLSSLLLVVRHAGGRVEQKKLK